MMIEFMKMSGAGNDFIVLDNRNGRYDDLEEIHIRRLCERKRGIGADGLIMLQSDNDVDFSMRYFNRDGREAEMCANGARCVVLFAHFIFPNRWDFSFNSPSGLHTGSLVNADGKQLVEIAMPSPTHILPEDRIRIGKRDIAFGFIVVGVPHVVIFYKEMPETTEILELGRNVRNHERFGIQGTNVNFVTVKGRDNIEIRTYERGVEEETLACGTGSTAASILSTLRGLTHPPVRCLTRGGDILTVTFEYDTATGDISNLKLLGEAQLVYEGRLDFRP
ncbi:MAG: diaminopimelate epimerase [Candidatus Glassbacteria bacterium]